MPHIRRRHCWRTALPTGFSPSLSVPLPFLCPPKDATTRTLNPLVHCPSPLRYFRLRPVTWPDLFPPKGRLPRRLGLISTTKPRNASAN